MNLADKHMVLLQNIESTIVSVHDNYPSLKDTQVKKALEELIKKYRALVSGRPKTEPTHSSEIESIIFKNIGNLLEKRRPQVGIATSEKPKSLFGRRNKEATSDEIFLACLRKIEKSVGRWNKRGGEKGYLNFIQGFV